jgi:hypothetical protein
MTRRNLIGGEDIYPADGLQAQASRGTQFRVSSGFNTGTISCSGSSTVGVLWVPPSGRSMLLRSIILFMDAGGVTDAPTNPGDTVANVFPSNVSNTLSVVPVTLTIPHTDWVSKGGGTGFNYNAGPQCNFTINGTGPKGTYGDSDYGTSTSQGVLPGNTGSHAGPGKVITWPFSDGSNTYTNFLIDVGLSGGDAGHNAIGGLSFTAVFEGSWL